MNEIIIDGRYIKTEQDFHKTLAEQCKVTEFYGCNLDALWDLLSAGVERPVCIIWHDSENSRKAMGLVFYQIIHILQRVKEQDELFDWADKFDYILK
ncbi:barstar family protein [Moraxella marmotae]|uniref:barstar family protein n=1 Tax=Moraxella marmotae TaxID=3344520 RepID=UPI0035F4F378